MGGTVISVIEMDRGQPGYHAGGGPVTSDTSILAVVVDMLGDLPKIAHIQPLPARRAFHVVVGLCPSDAVDVPTRLRHLQRL